MNNLTNYHSHCLYCDGVAPAEDFVKEAIAMVFSSYGISSHAPIPFESCWNMKQERLTDYIVEINSLKEKYKNEIELYIGLEIDYLDKTYNPASSIFQTTPLDYRIGSVHFLKTGDEQFIDIDTTPEQFKITVETIFNGDIIKLVRHYFDTMVQMIETGGFDFIGHADKISMNALSYRQGITSEKWYNELIQDYFYFIAEKGCMVEINTKAWKKKTLFFPNRQHFSLLKKFNIPVVVNADTHHPSLINDGRIDALHALLSEGFTHVRQLVKGEWKDVIISI